MRDSRDAFGWEIHDFFKNKTGCEIVERDDGYIESGAGPRIYFSQYRDWPVPVQKAMGYVRGRVLDIGCGAGRHALYVQQRGCDVLGTDNSPRAIAVCRSRGLRRARVVPISRLTKKLGRFDTVVMLGNNFGLFGSVTQARRLLKRFHGMTSDRGRIIAETLDPYRTTVPEHRMYHRRNRKRGRMAGQVRIRCRYKTRATPWFDYLFVSKSEMKKILQGTGWKVEKFLSGRHSYVAIIGKDR